MEWREFSFGFWRLLPILARGDRIRCAGVPQPTPSGAGVGAGGGAKRRAAPFYQSLSG